MEDEDLIETASSGFTDPKCQKHLSSCQPDVGRHILIDIYLTLNRQDWVFFMVIIVKSISTKFTRPVSENKSVFFCTSYFI